jgi:hypothetical protein
MRDNLRMRLFLAALAVALTLTGVTAVSASTPSSGGTPTTLVIKLKSHVTTSFNDDHPPKGDSKGDRYLVRDDLVNVAKQFGKGVGAVVGHDSGIIIVTAPKKGTISGVAILPNGKIRFEGPLNLTSVPGPPLEITGGSGRYAQARGKVVIGAGDFPLNTYHLTLPV